MRFVNESRITARRIDYFGQHSSYGITAVRFASGYGCPIEIRKVKAIEGNIRTGATRIIISPVIDIGQIVSGKPLVDMIVFHSVSACSRYAYGTQKHDTTAIAI